MIFRTCAWWEWTWDGRAWKGVVGRSWGINWGIDGAWNGWRIGGWGQIDGGGFLTQTVISCGDTHYNIKIWLAIVLAKRLRKTRIFKG